MLDKPASETVVASYEIGGRTFEIVRTVWRQSSKLSFDVHDRETQFCLTPDGLDDEPTAERVKHLLAELRRDYRDGTLDSFYKSAKNLAMVLFNGAAE